MYNMKSKFFRSFIYGTLLLLSGALHANPGATTFTRTVSLTSPTFTPVLTGGLLGGVAGCTMTASIHPYEAITFNAIGSVQHSATTTAITGMGTGDDFLAFYSGVFDPQHPTANLIGCNDDIVAGINQKAAFTTPNPLVAGQTYTAVFTSYGGGTGASGLGTGTFDVAPAVTPAFWLGGTLSGLGAGKSIVLQNSGGNNLTLSASGNFYFSTALPDTTAYSVTVLTQPVGQTCSVTSGSGSIAGANVSNVAVACNTGAPTASAVTISGAALDGRTLTGSYTYSDTEGDAQGISTFRWMRGSQTSGSDKAAISGATGSTYIVGTADAGNFVFFCVTPVASTGTLIGTEVCSGGAQVALISTIGLPASVAGVDAGQLTPLDLGTGYGPALTNCLLNSVRVILGADAVYDGQSGNGGARISLGNAVISFYPLQASKGSGQTPGIVLRTSNTSDVVTSCGTFTVAPAIFNLTEFSALLGGSGWSASINAEGVISAVVGNSIYVVRPDYFVTKGQPGTASLKLGTDGFYRFTDSAGNAQILRPAFLDMPGLQTQVQLALALRGWTLIQTDGTALFFVGDGRQFVLTPDLVLTAPPAANLSSFLWQDSPTHYLFRSNTLIPAQGFTVRPQ